MMAQTIFEEFINIYKWRFVYISFEFASIWTRDNSLHWNYNWRFASYNSFIYVFATTRYHLTTLVYRSRKQWKLNIMSYTYVFKLHIPQLWRGTNWYDSVVALMLLISDIRVSFLLDKCGVALVTYFHIVRELDEPCWMIVHIKKW